MTNQFPLASAPDILRSVQKDEFHLLNLRNQIMTVVGGLFGI